MVDIGIVLPPIEGLENMFQRIGYFEQCYWVLDTHAIFVGNKVNSVRDITII